MLAVELKLNNGVKYVFCTCYRVGTLGVPHHDAVISSIRPILSKTKPPKFFLIGDFNFSKTDWADGGSSTCKVEQNFIDSFSELGLKQHVTVPTHVKGNILDVLYTNFEEDVCDLEVMGHHSVCFSDHYAIKFNVAARINRKKYQRESF